MAELTRGTVADRPWGKTLGALGLRGLTGQLTLVADGKRYCIAFAGGAVVGASSPLINDAAVRVALTGHLVSSTQVGEITRRLAAQPDRDEVSVIAEAARLTTEQAQKLRRRVIAQRAARTFAVESGEFVVEDTVTIPVVRGGELDIRGVIYLGARTNFTDTRVATELAQFGGYFKLKPEAQADLPQFGFTELERPILAKLAGGSSLVDLEDAPSELNAHGVHAVVYALACCNACDAGPAAITSRTQTPTSAPQMSRTATPVTARHFTVNDRTASVTAAPTERRRTEDDVSAVVRARTTGQQAAVERPSTPTITPQVASGSGAQPSVDVARTTTRPTGTTPPVNVARTGSEPNAVIVSRTGSDSGPKVARTATPTESPTLRRRNDAAAKETEALIAERVAMLDAGADHFKLLGLAEHATADEARTAYFGLARKLHPDRLASLGIADEKRDAQRLFAQINTAFQTLTDPVRRADYVAVLKRGGEAAVKAEEEKVDDLAMRVMRAEEAFRRGEMALRRDQLPQAIAEFSQAVELQPKEHDYQALLAWAKFAAASDKMAVAQATRAALTKAAEESNTVTARFYLGRVERMLGREKEALNHFQQVLMLKPNHTEASSEVRVLEQRLKRK